MKKRSHQLLSNRSQAIANISTDSRKKVSALQPEDNRPETLVYKKLQAAQLARLDHNQAAQEASLSRAANQYNRAAITNNWILNGDEAATAAAWSALAPMGYVYNYSPSITNGGPNRPTSIDLKAKPVGAAESEFIFHLPKFSGIPDMITYLLRSSGIQNKLDAITQVSAINLGAPISDHDLNRIQATQTVDIAPLTGHPIYTANSVLILAHDPHFLTNLQTNQIDAQNTALNTIRTDARYTSSLANKNAREAKHRYTGPYNMVRPHLAKELHTINVPFDGIRMYLAMLNAEYAAASALFSQIELQNHKDLNARFDLYTEYQTFHAALKQTAEACMKMNFTTMEIWQKACSEYSAIGKRYEILKAKITAPETKEFQTILGAFRADLLKRKPQAEATAANAAK